MADPCMSSGEDRHFPARGRCRQPAGHVTSGGRISSAIDWLMLLQPVLVVSIA